MTPGIPSCDEQLWRKSPLTNTVFLSAWLILLRVHDSVGVHGIAALMVRFFSCSKAPRVWCGRCLSPVTQWHQRLNCWSPNTSQNKSSPKPFHKQGQDQAWLCQSSNESVWLQLRGLWWAVCAGQSQQTQCPVALRPPRLCRCLPRTEMTRWVSAELTHPQKGLAWWAKCLCQPSRDSKAVPPLRWEFKQFSF